MSSKELGRGWGVGGLRGLPAGLWTGILHPSQTMVGNRIRVLSPDCGRRAPLPSADSGVGRGTLAHPRILRRRVAGRWAGVDPLACLQSLRDSGRPG